jgi:hypothetical protein
MCEPDSRWSLEEAKRRKGMARAQHTKTRGRKAVRTKSFTPN